MVRNFLEDKRMYNYIYRMYTTASQDFTTENSKEKCNPGKKNLQIYTTKPANILLKKK